MRRLVVAALVLAAGLAGCAGDDDGETSSSAAPPAPFRYDATAPLGYRDLGRINEEYPIAVRDIQFTSPRGGRVLGFLTVPPGKGPYPAVIFLHGSGGSRVNFVPEAGWLSGRRIVGMTLNSPFTRPVPEVGGLDVVRQQRNLGVQAVVDVRRAIDVLRSLPQVDDDRIGLLGFSAGAKTAAIAAGVDPRFKAVVLVSGAAPSIESYVGATPAATRRQVRALLRDTDPSRYVGSAKGDMLVQIGRRDEGIPQRDLDAMADAAGDAEVSRHEAGHSLVTFGPAIREHLDFLSTKLDAGDDSVPGALTGPTDG